MPVAISNQNPLQKEGNASTPSFLHGGQLYACIVHILQMLQEGIDPLQSAVSDMVKNTADRQHKDSDDESEELLKILGDIQSARIAADNHSKDQTYTNAFQEMQTKYNEASTRWENILTQDRGDLESMQQLLSEIQKSGTQAVLMMIKDLNDIANHVSNLIGR